MRHRHRFAVLLPVTAVVALAACGRQPEAPGGPAPGSAPAAPAREEPAPIPARSTTAVVEISDLYHLRSAGDVRLSPDGSRVAFTVQRNDRRGSPSSEIWIAEVASGQAGPWPGPLGASSPRWSPDGRRLAFMGPAPGGKSGLHVANADGSSVKLVAEVQGSNHPWPAVGERLAWAPDGRQIAYVSAVDGPEPPMNDADPIVITRYWFRPSTSWPQRFSDNRRLHLFVADVDSGTSRQVTDGPFSEHSIDWSPDGRTLVFLSNREPDPDFFNNYDLFTLDVGSSAVTRLTETRNNEYRPRWSPDGQAIAYQGLTRPMTSSETNMEDTHVWVLDVKTGARRDLGAGLDNRQGPPAWSADGRWVYFTVQARGSVKLHRLAMSGGAAELVAPAADERASVGAFAVGAGGTSALSMATPASPADLYLHGPAGTRPLTALNRDLLGGKTLGRVEAFTCRSFDGQEVEAFLTAPARLDPGRRHPMIVMIHGGPHGQQGPMFNHRAQVYAGRGWAALMVNYRGSTGYGQRFANLIARDQNGGEAQDILAAVDAALARYPWIDPGRLGVEGGSYGGQLSNWLVTRTDRFKAAVPSASISNLVSHNYMSVYHDYLEQEYGGKPHTGGIMDMLWERSPIRYVDRVKTPVMFVHGDNDALVNPAEIEQFYIALKDVGVETVMVRYPREGHGMRETGHIADVIERSIAWYERFFGEARPD